MAVDKQKIEALLARNVEEVIEAKHLREALLAGKKLRVKLGIDPTGSQIHIGYAITLWKLKEFQDLGHKIILIIGDFTAQVGDASDKLQKRPLLSKEQVKKNLATYLPQIGKILDLKKTEVRYNSEWLGKLNFQEISQLAEIFTIRQMIERRNFKTRWDQNEEISLREFLYPLMQGYDSVAVKADIEIGGSDQLFNLLAGRKIQEHYGQPPQDVLTTKLLIGPDGRKMSKSWGNVINVTDSPEEQFGKVMALRDELIGEYLEMATDMAPAAIKELQKENKKKPKALKEKLALEIVQRYHGAAAAAKAQENWTKLFSQKEIPADIPELVVKGPKITALNLAVLAGAVKSKSEGRRLIEQGGLDIDGRAEKDPQAEVLVRGGEVVKLGKRRFFRLRIK